MLKLKGTDLNGRAFEELARAFFCGSTAKLKKDSLVEVFLLSGSEQFAGGARVVRAEAALPLGRPVTPTEWASGASGRAGGS